MASIVLLGTFDTKGHEFGFLADQLRAAGHEIFLVDAGIMGAPAIEPTITREAVAQAAGANLDDLIARADRGSAVTTMADGAREIVLKLFADGRLQGIAGLGGSGGTTLVTHAMRALPVGVPKLVVSTVASGDTRQYVGPTDITMMHSVVDISGINRISRRILENAAAAIGGMAASYAAAKPAPADRPLVAATMFGVTTPCVEAARAHLEAAGYEVLVFHATGTGGRSMEALVAGGFVAGVLDVTTTELADELVGGVLSAGQERLTVAGRHGVPQVVSVGAVDMVNFGPRETVPRAFDDRTFYIHNAAVTLMRTTPEECRLIGREIGTKLAASTGPVALYLPLGGVSAIAKAGGPFHDPAADAALFAGVRETAGGLEVHEEAADINDPAFARKMADRLIEMMRARAA